MLVVVSETSMIILILSPKEVVPVSEFAQSAKSTFIL
jgi:hypothetical protein